MAKNGVNDLGFKRFIKKLSLLIAFNERSQAVKVVPRFAPRITLTACLRVIIPELTRPTTITVEADDDCTSAVTPTPNR